MQQTPPLSSSTLFVLCVFLTLFTQISKAQYTEHFNYFEGDHILQDQTGDFDVVARGSSSLRILNCSFVGVGATGESFVSFQNGTLEYGCWAYENSEIYINNSSMRETAATGNSIVSVFDSSLSHYSATDSGSIYISGYTGLDSTLLLSDDANCYIYAYGFDDTYGAQNRIMIGDLSGEIVNILDQEFVMCSLNVITYEGETSSFTLLAAYEESNPWTGSIQILDAATAIPEPRTSSLIIAGLALAGFIYKRRKRRA